MRARDSLVEKLQQPWWPSSPVGHYVKGRASGYPSCCIVFFTALWYPTFRRNSENGFLFHRVYRRAMDCALRLHGERRFHYVPCPIHLVQGKVILPERRRAVQAGQEAGDGGGDRAASGREEWPTTGCT